MRSIETILGEGANIGANQQALDKKRAPKKTLHEEIVQMLKEDVERLEREARALRLRALSHDKKEMKLSREARSASEDADVLLEAVTELARVVSNTRREERAVRERVRQLLEAQGIPPPSTLGSSRDRKKAGKRKSGTTKSP